MVDVSANIPAPMAPMVDIATGQPTQAWWMWFQRVLTRTGGPGGVDAAVVQTTAGDAKTAAATANDGVAAEIAARELAISGVNAGWTAAVSDEAATRTAAVAAEKARALAAEALLAPKAGTTTNDNAPAGGVGEYIEAVVLTGSAVTLTTMTPANVASISLTAGDWDVSGTVQTVAGGTTVTQYLIVSVGATSATVVAPFMEISSANAAGGSVGLPSQLTRVSIAATTTIYLVAQAGFTISTLKAFGTIRARRMR
jgi:hypothetical protein